MFLNQDFLLTTESSKKLYHDYGEKLPIIDYHCHLEPQEIYENKPFETITQAWLGGDHYKWRLLRANGVSEELITGAASDYDKFLAWAETIEGCIGNPLYVWTHLELKRIFGIHLLLNRQNAPEIWTIANQKLKQEAMRPRNIIKNMGVKVICTTDDPHSDLIFHQKLRAEEKAFQVFPTFRPDKAISIGKTGFGKDVEELAQVTGRQILGYQELLAALRERMDYFHEQGCRLSDHSFTELIYKNGSSEEVNGIFTKALKGAAVSKEEAAVYQFALLCDLLKMYHDRGWTCQLHLSATRSNNQQLFDVVGADAGGDGMNDGRIIEGLTQAFNQVNSDKQLPKVILYSLNPKDFVPLAALIGCFQGETKGKLQLGAAWWFNDTYSGMRQQLTVLAEGGILGNFVGMLTDSRSFLSYPRHEYFRRILCQLVGEWVQEGQLPDESDYLGKIIADISYNNAKEYFNFYKD